MYKDYNGNTAYLYTFPVSCINFISNKEIECQLDLNETFYENPYSFFHRKVNKKDIFDDIYNLGRTIVKEFPNLIFISKIIDNGNSLNFDSNYSFFRPTNVSILDNYYYTIDILKSDNIKTKLSNFFLQYGVSESLTSFDSIQEYLMYNHNENDGNYNVTQILRRNIFKMNNEWIPINISNMNKYKVPATIYTIVNVIPFINTCMLIYYIKRFTYAINKGEPSTIFNLLQVFPELETFGIKTNDRKTYNETTRKSIIEFVNRLILSLNPYLQQYFIKNYSKPIYPPNLEEITERDIYDNKDIQWAFNLTEHCIITPILAAYDYLLQNIHGRNTLEYFCDNCGTILHIKSKLCYDCKINFYNQIIRKYEKTNEKKASILEKELDKFIKESETSLIPTVTPLIDKIYREQVASRTYYHKNKDNFD